jgi:SAM-dependent methyltransferase
MSTDASWVDSMPAVYDRALGPVLFAPWAQELARRAATRSPQRVLELAAGTGIATAALLRALPGAAVTATDLNPAMVAWGAEHVPGAAWQQADAQALPLPDGAVDLVVCAFGWMFFPDKAAAFGEARRVLAPGGSVLAAVWDVVETSPITEALVESLHAVLPEDPPTFVLRVPHGYTDEARIRADVVAGGLRVDGVERAVLRGRASSAQLLADGFCQGTPLRFELEKRGDLQELTRSVGRQMTDRLGSGPVERELAAYVISASAG